MLRTAALSSSAGDYRSIIDDLTMENQKLQELKMYKQDFRARTFSIICATTQKACILVRL